MERVPAFGHSGTAPTGVPVRQATPSAASCYGAKVKSPWCVAPTVSENDRDERGHFQPEHGDQEYLTAVAEHEPAGTKEVAEAVGVTRQNADQRLRRLEDEGKVTSKKIGNSLAWSLAGERHAVRHVEPDDAFWEAETYAGEQMSAEDIDDVLYG